MGPTMNHNNTVKQHADLFIIDLTYASTYHIAKNKRFSNLRDHSRATDSLNQNREFIEEDTNQNREFMHSHLVISHLWIYQYFHQLCFAQTFFLS